MYNVKSGLSKLFAAEILTIISGISVVINGEKLEILAAVLSLLGTAEFVVNLVGLKQCALDSEAFGIFSDTVVGSVVLITGLLFAVAAIAALFVAQIKYIIFLKKSSDSL